MKIAYLTILIPLLFLSGYSNLKKVGDQKSTEMHIKGHAGEMIDKCIDVRVKGQDIDHLVAPFTLKNETWCWQSEFWGKWMLSAVSAYKYTRDQDLLAKMEYAVKGLLDTQLKSGYIGNYGPQTQLTRWDIWGRKYSMLGLIKYFEITNDKRALKAASKVADHLISQVGPGKTNIIKSGFYHGMASSSVLEPIVYLYNISNEERYLDFANYIVGQWKTEGGPDLIGKALEGVNVADRFPPPEKWWSWENGQKAYEMMSCYDGLLELYKITKKPEYLKAIIKTVDNILETEINIAGSGSAFECWYGTVERQTQPTYHTMETCVTQTWMKLCNKLLEVTGDSKYADQIELSFYNALMASMKFDGSEIAKYSPLEGNRIAGEEQCSMHINCCNANGPRGFVMMPSFGINALSENIFINYYGESEASIRFDNANEVKITQSTSYPESGKVLINLAIDVPREFSIYLRIPGWSENTDISVNGDQVSHITPGKYMMMKKEWRNGDQISLEFDMRGRLLENNYHQAVKRGPIILARDSRFEDGYVDEAATIQHKDGIIDLVPINRKPERVWMAFEVPCVLGTDLEGEGKQPKPILFNDFASAGNTWDPSTRYRVWIPKTLNVMKRKYEGY